MVRWIGVDVSYKILMGSWDVFLWHGEETQAQILQMTQFILNEAFQWTGHAILKGPCGHANGSGSVKITGNRCGFTSKARDKAEEIDTKALQVWTSDC